jgi:uncharacterized protein
VTRRAEETYHFTGDEFDSVRGETRWTMAFERDDWQVRTVTSTVLSCTPDAFHLHAQLDAYEGGERVIARNWTHRIPRNLV